MNSHRLLTIVFLGMLLSACGHNQYRTEMPLETAPKYFECAVDSVAQRAEARLLVDSAAQRAEVRPLCEVSKSAVLEDRKCTAGEGLNYAECQSIQHRYYQSYLTDKDKEREVAAKADGIAMITNIGRSTVHIERDEKNIKVKAGYWVKQSDKLFTGTDGDVSVTFSESKSPERIPKNNVLEIGKKGDGDKTIVIQKEVISGNYYLSFVEFDDQGWFTDRKQMEALFALLEKLKKEDQEVLINVYAHGWKHNASPCDNNVVCFSRVLERHDIAEQANGTLSETKPRTVVGVYIGWRGLPFGTFLNNVSFWARKDAAARVGRGGVFELLTRLNDYRDSRRRDWCVISLNSIEHEQEKKDFFRKNCAEDLSADTVYLRESRQDWCVSKLNDKLYRNDWSVEISKKERDELPKNNAYVARLKEFDKKALSKIKRKENELKKLEEKCKNHLPPNFKASPLLIPAGSVATQLVITGHSFGGLVIYEALSHALMERAARNKKVGDPSKDDVAKSFGDFVVLVNPAFEGSRYEPLFQISTNRCYDKEKQRPVMMVVTSDADSDTRVLFPIGRTLSTIFQHKKSPAQADSMHKTVGHDPRYQTHSLALNGKDLQEPPEIGGIDCGLAKAEKPKKRIKEDESDCGCPYLKATSEFDLESILPNYEQYLKELMTPKKISTGSDTPIQVPPAQYTCENVKLKPVLNRSSSQNKSQRYVSSYPYLVVKTDANFIPDHNAIYNDRFINFAQSFFLYHIAGSRPLPGNSDKCWKDPQRMSGGLSPEYSCQLADGSPCSQYK